MEKARRVAPFATQEILRKARAMLRCWKAELM
jgi:hypothetical protein